jgi:hypothetical protein
VKAYAADFCGTATLRDAGRDQVEAFINNLAESAAKDREALIGQLNTYSKQQEAISRSATFQVCVVKVRSPTTCWMAFSWSASIESSIAGIRNGRSTFCG